MLLLLLLLLLLPLPLQLLLLVLLLRLSLQLLPLLQDLVTFPLLRLGGFAVHPLLTRLPLRLRPFFSSLRLLRFPSLLLRELLGPLLLLRRRSVAPLVLCGLPCSLFRRFLDRLLYGLLLLPQSSKPLGFIFGRRQRVATSGL